MNKKTLAAIWIICFGAAGFSMPGAQTAAQVEKVLEAARHKEVVDGDPGAAIRQYRDIVAKYSTNRAVAAEALVRMGQCYEKLGVKETAEARKAYDLVLSKFADQAQAVTQARARLAALGTGASGVSYRQVWSGPKVASLGTVSPDGKYLTAVDWDTGDLVLHDFAANTDRRLTNKGTWGQSGDFAEISAISRDGKLVAYSWFSGKNGRYDLRMASLQTPGFPEPRRLVDSKDLNWITPYDWSPDGNWLAVTVQRNGGVLLIGLVSTQDGSLRVLKSPASAAKMFFSPDSKFLGFDFVDADNVSRDVLVLRLDGSGETKAAAGPSQDFMMGWSPDGRYLLFASDRRGAMDLWAVPMAEGRAAGTPELVRPDIPNNSLGVTASGALYLGATISDRDIQVASLDFNTGKLLSPPVKPIQTYIGHNLQPDWSPDGKYLAYKRTSYGWNSDAGDQVLAIRSLETGQTRELRPKLRNLNFPRWAPDGRSFAAQGIDWNGRQGIYRIDAQTGEAAPISVNSQGMDPLRGSPQWSLDGKKILHLSDLRGNAEQVLMELDLASGNERELIRKKLLRQLIVSPDGRYLATLASDTPGQSLSVLIIPTAGGETQTLPQIGPPPQSFYLLGAWAQDNSGVIVYKRLDDAGKKWEWWLVPIGDGQARKLDLETPQMLSPIVSPIRMHPDGRQIAYVAGGQQQEVWVLENFLPKATK